MPDRREVPDLCGEGRPDRLSSAGRGPPLPSGGGIPHIQTLPRSRPRPNPDNGPESGCTRQSGRPYRSARSRPFPR